jgi:hypothetical protein
MSDQTYPKKSRKLVLALLDAGDIPYDSVTCHRDGSITLRREYFYGGQPLKERIVTGLEAAHATVLHARDIAWAKDPYVEVRFAFEPRDG